MISGNCEVFGLGKAQDLYNSAQKWVGKSLISVNLKTGKEESKRILDVSQHKCDKIWSYEIHTANGNKITITADQVIIMDDMKKIKGSDIQVGTELKCQSCQKDTVTKIEKKIIPEMYGLAVEGAGAYIANDFILCS